MSNNSGANLGFEWKMTELTDNLYDRMREAQNLDEVIRRNLEVVGYAD